MNLPLKYRPTRFEEIVGQQIPVSIARISIAQSEDKLQTTYLLVGPSGSGKTTLARIMARSFNCKQRENDEPCGDCSSCKASLNHTSLAITEIDGADRNGVDDVRDIIEKCQLNVINNKYRIFIIDEAHQMSKPAQNALLKTLEDTPQNTIFILCTTEEDRLLETIKSRARILRFSTVSKALVTGFLLNVAHHENIELSEAEAQVIYKYNQGSIRRSLQTISMLSDGITVANLCPVIKEDDLLQLLLCFQTKDYLGINSILEKIVSQGFESRQVLESLVDKMIELMASKRYSSEFVANANRVVETIVPRVTSSNYSECRFTLYHAAVAWHVEPSSSSELLPNSSALESSQQHIITISPQVDGSVTESASNGYAVANSDSNLHSPQQFAQNSPEHQAVPKTVEFALPTGHDPYPV
ncbi:MAG: DNA polymerase III subunit gamma/tau [Cyanobacteria bacterium J06621_8]